MKRATLILAIIFLLIPAVAGCNQKNAQKNENAKIIVYTSVYPMYDFAKKVGGDLIQLTNMVPAGTEPHDWEPAAADIANLNSADVFVYNGAGMEHWVDKVLSTLKNKKLMVIKASEGIPLITEQTGEEDPHIWLNPLYAKRQTETIKNALVAADPENSATYETNYNKYAAEFDKLDKEFKETLSSLPRKEIIVAHQAFGYLCAQYGLEQIAIEGLLADSEPEPARMAQIIELAKKYKINVVFFEELVSPKVAETIAKAINAKTQVLNPLEGISNEAQTAGEDYFSVMRKNLQVLKEALQ